MAIRKRFAAGKSGRRLYGFIDGVVKADPENPYSRETLLLDCVDAVAFDASPEAALAAAENLLLVRAVSTRRRWTEDLGLEGVKEGDWVVLTLEKRAGSPRAWGLPADNDYESEGPTNISSIAALIDDGELSETPPGPDAPIGLRLRHHSRLLGKERLVEDQGQLPLFLSLTTGKIEVVCLDVGQASCNVIRENGVPTACFDVGAPLYRNNKSFRSRAKWPLPKSGAVVLSHWDFDHFDLGRRLPHLQALSWFAPDQPVGPNTLRFQRKLGTNLKFLVGSYSGVLPGGTFSLEPGLSTDPKDRNGTGYSLRIDLDDAALLLTGDADYSMIPPAMCSGLSAMTVPHHGGLCSSPPNPSGVRGRAVLSYGRPNCYRHPVPATIAALQPSWDIHYTASHPGCPTRGDRRLYP